MTFDEVRSDPVRWKKFIVFLVAVGLGLAWLMWPADALQPERPGLAPWLQGSFLQYTPLKGGRLS